MQVLSQKGPIQNNTAKAGSVLIRISANSRTISSTSTGSGRGVVKDNAVGDQSAALRPEVLLVFGTVRIGRMNLGLDVRRVVEQDVEHVMAFVLVCSDDVGINRDVVGDQSVGNDSFLKTEVLR